MNNILTRSGKISVIFACVLLLVVSASAQVGLRKALDFDGDNRADYSVFRPSDNVWYINRSNGGFQFQQFGSSNTDYQTPGDFDGDGRGDISVWRDTNGVWYRLNSSDNTFSGVQFGITGDEPVGRDYDGDGKTDQAVVRRSNGVMTWYVLRSTNGQLQAAQFGAATDYTAPGDYDGDLKFDYAVQRPGANAADPAIFYILQTQTNTLSSIPWGTSSDLVVPGDYDGDGKTDVAVIREGSTPPPFPQPTNQLFWFIRNSSNGSLTSLQFGASFTDLSAQADYDGDGKTDIAVWRDTNGTFYVRKSLDTNLITAPWGAPNDFPIASYDTH